MHKTFIIICNLLLLANLSACKLGVPATDSSEKTQHAESAISLSAENPFINYRPFRTVDVKLQHTKLELSFDWEKRQVNGVANLLLAPYAQPTKSISLDAKSFDVHFVKRITDSVDVELSYQYDGYQIQIDFEEAIGVDELINLQIAYTAKPDEIQLLSKINNPDRNKGLYFVTPEKYTNKHYQIWTQGESESSSCWFPTIDAPNQRTTQEMYITVGDSMKTLSNGLLVYSKFNGDNTRTDYWKMDQAHAPYLFMLAVGDFAVVEDQWNDIPLTYYVEQKFEKSAKHIFGNTPEMLSFFSDKLGINFPWQKYAQVIVRDFVSGAMENTTVSVFNEFVQVDSSSLIDENHDDIIAHELFHQWFGNMVTCRDWSQIALNESFAEYSEYLWAEHKVGKAEADYKLVNMLESFVDDYLDSAQAIIRYQYRDPEDLFDSFTYEKGAAVLHMLRHYLGDDLFFKSLNHYLKVNAFQNVEISDLRKSFETISGRDLKWFFHQWFMHPKIPMVTLEHDFADGQLSIKLMQELEPAERFIFKLPLQFLLYRQDGTHIVHDFLFDQLADSFSISLDFEPALVYPNPDLSALVVFDHAKGLDEYLFQLKQVNHFYSRYEAAINLSNYFKSTEELDPEELNSYLDLLRLLKADEYWFFRQFFLDEFYRYSQYDMSFYVETLKQFASADPSSTIRSDALAYMSLIEVDDFEKYFINGLKDSSASVVAMALYAYLEMNEGKPQNEQLIADFYESDNPEVILILADYFASNFADDKVDWFLSKITVLSPYHMGYYLPLMGQLVFNSEVDLQYKVLEPLLHFAKYAKLPYLRLISYNSLDYLTKVETLEETKLSIKKAELNQAIQDKM